MTRLILSLNKLDYAIIDTGYSERFLYQEKDNMGKFIIPIDQLIKELREDGI